MRQKPTKLDSSEILLAFIFLSTAVLIFVRLTRGAGAAGLDNYIAVAVSVMIILEAKTDSLSGQTGSSFLGYVKKEDDKSTFSSLVTVKYLVGFLCLGGSVVKWLFFGP